MTQPHSSTLCASILFGAAALTAQQASGQARQPESRQEVVTETSTAGPRQQTRDDVFIVDERGQRRLLETTESAQETFADGSLRLIETTSAPDANGRLGVTSRYVEDATTTASGRHETVGVLFEPGVNGSLRESRRTETTEREVTPDVVRLDRIERVRGQNGQWETTEVRSRETKAVGPGDSVADETIQRRDSGGKLVVSQRDVTRRTEANGRVVEVTETFGDNQQGRTRPSTPMGLSQRVTRTTTASADGGSSTVEEVEGSSITAPNERMRVVRRTVETVREVNGQTETERQVFERDTNGRMVLVSSDAGTDEPTPAGTSRRR